MVLLGTDQFIVTNVRLTHPTTQSVLLVGLLMIVLCRNVNYITFITCKRNNNEKCQCFPQQPMKNGFTYGPSPKFSKIHLAYSHKARQWAQLTKNLRQDNMEKWLKFNCLYLTTDDTKYVLKWQNINKCNYGSAYQF